VQATMIRIEDSAKMKAAVERCKLNHPKVRRRDAQTVTVYGSRGTAYTVRFIEPRSGLKLAACNCPAGLESKLCYHIPAAIVAPVAAVAPQSVAKVSDERESLIDRINAAWAGKYSPLGIAQGLLKRFGVNQLAMLQTHHLRAIVAVLK